ncbi:MAG: alpha-glucosidase [Spirochaetales bacterium]|nr:alpha-glucosidase [Spirochaetales bacterium]
MIHLEAAEDGFVISLDGRRALVHTTHAPLIEMGSAEPAIRQRKGGFTIRQKRFARVKARAWKQIAANDDFLDIEFEGLVRMTVRDAGSALRITFSRYDSTFNRFLFRLPATPGESVFGCGEQYSRLDLKGSRVPLWSEEQGVGRGHDLITLLANLWGGAGGNWHTTYFGQPSFVTSGRSYAHVGTTAYCVFDFRRAKTTVLSSWAVPDEIILGFAADAPGAVGALSERLGRQKALPAWTWNGVWLGAQGGYEELRRKLDAATKAGVKVGAVWAQDWCGRRITSFGKQLQWNWRFDRELYPNLPEDISRLRREGVRFLGYINPFLAIEGDLYAEASKAGFCVKKLDGSDYLVTVTTFPAAIVDLYNPDAYAWIKNVIKREMLGIGMAGWMADFGEHLPIDAVLHGGRDPLLAHNEYPVLWAKVNAEAIRESGKEGDVVCFHRSGWAGSSAYASAFWAGDQLVNWSRDDGLASVVPAALSLGFSGSGMWHSDIGGYTTVAWIKRSRELLMRWTELAAFTPIMRSHEGNRPESNAQLWSDPAILAHLARMSAVWTGLAPYHADVADAYVSTGLPPIRHTWLHYEEEPELRRLSGQYLYGRDLLVAPVTRPGKKLSTAWLPTDQWVHLWTSREFRGGEVTIESPLGYPPVFYRTDSPWASLFEGLRRSVKKL